MLDIRLKKVVEPNEANKQTEATATFEIFDDANPEKALRTVWIQFAEGDDVQAKIRAKIAEVQKSMESRQALRVQIETALTGIKTEMRK